MQFLLHLFTGCKRGQIHTGSRLQQVRLLRTNDFFCVKPALSHNVKKFSYDEHLPTTRTFLCIKVLVVSGRVVVPLPVSGRDHQPFTVRIYFMSCHHYFLSPFLWTTTSFFTTKFIYPFEIMKSPKLPNLPPVLK